jgi:glucosamine--fructose-6-phosphate aminotransferase (isomerizing)
MSDNHLFNEIMEEPAVLERVYGEYVEQSNPALMEAVRLINSSPAVFMTGMATSEYSCIPASCLLSHAGKPNTLYDVSELLYYHLEGLPKGAVLIVVSQSGESAEIVHLLEEVKGRVPIVGVYNNQASTLAKGSTIGLPILAGPQKACGSKTNTATIAVMNLMAEKLLGRDIHKAGEQIQKAITSLKQVFENWEEALTPGADLLEASSYSVFVGRGPGRASAIFSAVLFREVPKVVAEGMAAATFRHGLREMITPDHRVVIFAPQGKTTRQLVGLAEDMLKLGVPVCVFTNHDIPLEPSKQCWIYRTGLLDEFYSPLVDITPPQLLGYILAKRRGLEPGKLVISTYITTVE